MMLGSRNLSQSIWGSKNMGFDPASSASYRISLSTVSRICWPQWPQVVSIVALVNVSVNRPCTKGAMKASSAQAP